ncbi:MAG: hypothetical protein GX879_11040, partial [Bacteroidales bacterium]|nr:hypothetical protein [Bacteroidales bacterium]
MNIRYIKHENIDKKLWDNCINSSQFPMIYASSDFLDIVSPNWAGIVLGNYETVMPVTFRKKLGI